MSCLFCRYFEPIEPEQHKKDREARRCRAGCGNEWSIHTAGAYVRAHNMNLEGLCHLEPQLVKVKANDVCSHIDPLEYVNGTRPDRIDPNENLSDWSRSLMNRHVHGTWREQQEAHLRAQNAELKALLKVSRERSRKRMERIQALEKDKQDKRDKDATKVVPMPLRLVVDAAE